jgi:5-methylthioadenosine/S-adenosylhomocysteine deaminase
VNWENGSMSLLLRNVSWLVTQNQTRAVLRNVSVRVEDGIITEIGTNPREAADQIIDCEGKIVLPGLINTHTHLAMTMFRGYADDMRLEEWLQSKIWPLERNLTPEICHYGALLGCLEMISTGTTTFLDMYFHMEEVAKAVAAAGLRAYLSHAVFGGEGSELEEKSKESTERFVRFLKELQNPQVNLAIGPHAIYSCSPELLVWSKEVAEQEKTVLHIHLAETRSEQARVEKEHGIRETGYLEKLGFLCPNLLAAHCVWLTKSEVSTLAKRGVKVSHCPVSNMKLASGGVAPIPQMLERGVVVSIGTDGAASNNSLDMFESMKVCALAQAHQRWDPAILAPQKVLDFATIDAAKALGIESRIGSVEVEKEADLVVINTMTPNLVPLDGGSLISDLVYSAKGYNVETTIVHGELLMKNRVIQTLNESEIYEKTQENALTLIKQG